MSRPATPSAHCASPGKASAASAYAPTAPATASSATIRLGPPSPRSDHHSASAPPPSKATSPTREAVAASAAISKAPSATVTSVGRRCTCTHQRSAHAPITSSEANWLGCRRLPNACPGWAMFTQG